MKISACSFINKGTTLGYPFIESIRSALELVDEFVIAVGPEPDGTREAIEAIDDPRIRIIDTTWDPGAPGSFVHGQQTMVALYNCTGSWVLSIQGDEAIHEDDCPELRLLIKRAHADGRADAIVMNYHHFYGRPDLLATGPRWYRAEARLMRTEGRRVIIPTGAQFLANITGRHKLTWPRAVKSNAWFYHYGWVRSAESHDRKIRAAKHHRHPEGAPVDPYHQVDARMLAPFKGTHPAAMQPWLDGSANWDFEPDPKYTLSMRDHRQRFKAGLEKLLRADFSCTHFRRMRLKS